MTPESNNLTDWWASARPIETQALARRDQRIRRLKRILPLAGGLVLALALLWPVIVPALPEVDWSGEVQNTGKEPAMLNLQYRGTSDKGEPFSLTADKAVRNIPLGMDAKKFEAAPQIGLTVPKANIVTTDGKAVDINANNGQYDETSQGLNLTGDVRIKNSDGMQLDAPQLSVDFKQNRAWTDQPVTARGKSGTITGEGLKLEDGGKTIIFTGESRAVLNGDRPAEDSVENTGQAPANQP